MKKLLLPLVAAIVPLLSLAQGWPANYGGVMLQGFYWGSYQLDQASMLQSDWTDKYWDVPRTTWSVLNSTAVKNQITPFIDLIWLPQSGATTAPAWQSDYNPPEKYGKYQAEQMVEYSPGKWHLETWDFEHKNDSYRFNIAHADRMGFIPVWWFDHGKGLTYTWKGDTYTPSSAFGTEEELRKLIKDYAAEKTYAIEDVVVNHKGGPGMWSNDKGRYLIAENSSTDKPTDNEASCDVTWNYDTNVDIVDDAAHDYYSEKPYKVYDEKAGKWVKSSESGFTGGEWGKDLNHASENVQENVIKYLNFLKNDLGYAGFRYDYVKGYDPKYLAMYNLATRPTFSVGEFFDGDQVYLESWIDKTYAEDNYQSAAFDFPLKFKMNECFADPTKDTYENYQVLNDAGLIANYKMRRYAVTFVDNHDTFKNIPSDNTHRGYGNRMSHHVVEANMFILGMPGTPCLFYPHYMRADWQPIIQDCIKARRAAGITNQAAISLVEKKGSKGVRFLITGTKGRCVIQLGPEAQAEGTPSGFQLVRKNDHCSFFITEGLDWQNNEKEELIGGFAIIDQPSGNYTGSLTVNITPSNDATTVVYTTNGTTPDAGSKKVGAGYSFTITENTTVKAAVVVNGVVDENSVVTRDYVFDDNNKSGQVKVYISYSQVNGGEGYWYNEKPCIYAWKGDTKLTGDWPGWCSIGNTETVAGVKWYVATIPAVGFNMQLHRGYADNSDLADITKSATIKNVTHDIFLTYTDGVPRDVTAMYGAALHDPKLSIDIPSGTYEGSLKVNLNTTLQGDAGNDPKAKIVYTVSTSGGQMPAKPSATQTTNVFENGKGVVTINADNAAGSTFYLRAALVKDGKIIDEQARSYFIKKVNEAKTGIHIYVKNMTTDDEPNIYAWTGSGASEVKKNGEWPGNKGSETRTAYGQTWSYLHIDANAAKVVFNLGTNVTKTADISISSAGDYFYYYYPGAYQFKYVTNYGDNENDSQDVSHAYNGSKGYIDVTSSSTKTTSTKAYTFFINSSSPSSAALHVWNNGSGTKSHGTKWREHIIDKLPQTNVNGKSWYYLTCIDGDAEVRNMILFKANDDENNNRVEKNNLNNFSNRETSSIAYSYFFTYPKNGNTWTDADWNTDDAKKAFNALSGQSPSTNAGDAGSTLKYITYDGLSSCVTPIEEGRQGFYFENDADFGMPFTWVYNGTTAYSGNAWPGEQLLEVIGTAPNGNTIYRWTWNNDGEGTIPDAARVIFSNNGDNTTQTADMQFHNNGYYTSTTYKGDVSGNFMTLAALIAKGKKGTTSTSVDYTITNNLEVAFISANGYLYAKDKDGDALNISTPKADEVIYDKDGVSLASHSYDQSNWIAIKVLNVASRDNFDGKTLFGSTINGKFMLDEGGNPVLLIDEGQVQYEPVYDPITTKSSTNVYYPEHFGDHVSGLTGETFFMVAPKLQEYAIINDAIYYNGAFYTPARDASNNYYDFSGGVGAITDDANYLDANYTFVNNQRYNLTAIIRGKGGSKKAPHRVSANTDALNGTYELVIIHAETSSLPTGIEEAQVERTVQSVNYVDLMGRVSDRPHTGVNVVITRYTDGTTSTAKVLF